MKYDILPGGGRKGKKKERKGISLLTSLSSSHGLSGEDRQCGTKPGKKEEEEEEEEEEEVAMHSMTESVTHRPERGERRAEKSSQMKEEGFCTKKLEASALGREKGRGKGKDQFSQLTSEKRKGERGGEEDETKEELWQLIWRQKESVEKKVVGRRITFFPTLSFSFAWS